MATKITCPNCGDVTVIDRNITVRKKYDHYIMGAGGSDTCGSCGSKFWYDC